MYRSVILRVVYRYIERPAPLPRVPCSRPIIVFKVMYLALGSVHPTTLAVGNTMKRVFLVAASLIVFKTPITRMGMVGSVIAVGGVLVYSLTKQHFDVLERKKASEKKQQ